MPHSTAQMPERSGFPSAVRGAGAERFGRPSGNRGIAGEGYVAHWPRAVAASHRQHEMVATADCILPFPSILPFHPILPLLPYLPHPPYLPYLRCRPPSTRIVSPVMKSLSSSPRTAFAISFSPPQWPSG